MDKRSAAHIIVGVVIPVVCWAFVWRDMVRRTTPPTPRIVVTPEAPAPVPLTVSLRRCNDILTAQRLMTDLQIQRRWPVGPEQPIQWSVRVVDVQVRYEGAGGMEVHFTCPEAPPNQMTGTFYAATGTYQGRRWEDINRGSLLTIQGYLHRPEGHISHTEEVMEVSEQHE